MSKIDSHTKGYILAAIFGAAGGGFVVLALTKAIPKMIQRIMSGMMCRMMGEMASSGCFPGEI